ncbi:MAG TPA: TOBE domain-containing protein [Amycolatopsis sp.]|nr:TOBE domain-containing protein [Amycolatopsis sp.]
MGLSIRNRFAGTVTAVTPGEAMATVRTRLSGGQEITAAITRDAVEDLGLAAGSRVRVLIKSTEVSLATGTVTGISIRNRLQGRVTAVTSGEAMATVKVALKSVPGTGGTGGTEETEEAESTELTAAITRDAVTELGLAAGSTVIALIKATEIVLATD